MRVHQAASSYSAQRSFRAWLFAIATNLMRSHFRKQKVRRIMVSWWRPTRSGPEGGRELDPADAGPSPEQQTLVNEQVMWLERALDKLPTRWRQALVLTQLEGLSHKEAAEALGVPATSIKTWVHRARTSLASERARALKQGATP